MSAGSPRWSRARRAFDAAAVLTALQALNANEAEDRHRRVCSPRAATRATPRPRRKSGKTWPGSRPPMTNSRPTSTRRRGPGAGSSRRSAPQLGSSGRRLAEAATSPIASRRLVPDLMASAQEARRRGARPWGGRRGGVLVPDDAETPQRRRNRRARGRRRQARRADFSCRRLHVLPCTAESDGRRTARTGRRPRAEDAVRHLRPPEHLFRSE